LKKIASICLVFFTLMMVFMGTALAEPEFTEDTKIPYVLLMDADSGRILYSTDNIDEQIRPASTTKIMTCILAIENADLDSEVTVSSNATGVGGSTIDLVTGDKLSLRDLLIGMMLESGNDAALAVAEHVAGSVDAFVTIMNDKAEELGMTGTHYVTPHGKDEDGHLTTAMDMAKLAMYAMKNPTFMEIVDTQTFNIPIQNARELKNTNYLIREDETDKYYPYANGIKTGSTPLAGRCVVASAKKDGMNLLCLLFGDPDENGPNRWPLAKQLFDFGFNNFQTLTLSEALANSEPVQVTVQNYAANDAGGGVITFSAEDFTQQYVTIENDVADKILDGTYTVTASATYDESLSAPITEGQVLGTVTYTCVESEDIIYSGDLIAPRDVVATGMEPDANGNTAVATMSPLVPEEVVTTEDNALVWIWVIIPAGLVVFLVIRLVTVNKRKRRRFKKRRPHYSYRIK